jgi:hypothetical protein
VTTHELGCRKVKRPLNVGRDVEIATQDVLESVAQVGRKGLRDPLRIDRKYWGPHLSLEWNVESGDED